MEGLSKTPDEIKKALQACGIDGACDREICQYHATGGGNKCIPSMCKDALAYIQQLERERDALLKALKDTDINCDYCKHSDIMQNVCKCDCSFCDIPADDCHCNECRNNSHWEWRGVVDAKDATATEDPNHSPFPNGMTQAEWLGLKKEDAP